MLCDCEMYGMANVSGLLHNIWFFPKHTKTFQNLQIYFKTCKICSKLTKYFENLQNFFPNLHFFQIIEFFFKTCKTFAKLTKFFQNSHFFSKLTKFAILVFLSLTKNFHNIMTGWSVIKTLRNVTISLWMYFCKRR